MIEKIKITNLNININNNTNNKWIKIRKDVYKDREIPEDNYCIIHVICYLYDDNVLSFCDN